MANPIPFLSGIDLSQTELRRAVLQVLAAAPSTPVAGQGYWDSILNAPRYYNGTTWTLPATDSLLLQGQNGAYYLSRTNHTGTQIAATISNFDTQVRTSRLDQMAAPTASVSFSGQILTNLADPVGATDGATRQFVLAQVSSAVQGLQLKPTAQVATAAALPANTYLNGSSGVGATLTATANGALTVDTSYAVVAGDYVLVKNEVASANNGLYVVTQAGNASALYILTRHMDMDQSTEFGGAAIPVANNGAANKNSFWVCNVANSITVGTTAVALTQIAAPTSLAGTSSILLSGGLISAIVTTGLVVTGAGIGVDYTVTASRYSTTIGDGTTTTFTVTHNLNTRAVSITVKQAAAPYQIVFTETDAPTVNTATIAFNTAPTAGQYLVVIE